MALAGAVALAATGPVRADHGVCVVEADLTVPNGSPVGVLLQVTPGNPGTVLIDYDQYGVYTADANGQIRLLIPANFFGSHVVPLSVHFAFTGENECEDPTLTVQVGLPDTSVADPSAALVPQTLATILASVVLLLLSLVQPVGRRSIHGG